jgi:hypothetical protein
MVDEYEAQVRAWLDAEPALSAQIVLARLIEASPGGPHVCRRDSGPLDAQRLPLRDAGGVDAPAGWASGRRRRGRG